MLMALLEVTVSTLLPLRGIGFGKWTRCQKSKCLFGNASYLVFSWERCFWKGALFRMPNVGFVTRPCDGWYTLNSDGSALGNPGGASDGGLIHDSRRRWIKGFTRNIEVGERANGVVTGVVDGGVEVLEALDVMADDFGEVGRGGVRVGRASEGEKMEGVLAGEGFWVRGNGVVEEVEEHWESFRGEVLDCGLEISMAI
ncbi:hypothetical protein SO802_000944 [Lithocarpus litseifolius]|uniref:Uncharacterized protein n=1 Tax=Lithocarpus litseifolius TaxID=425828 RepID=A0AAW2DSY7_9ROSI